MRRRKANALGKRFFADNAKHNRLAAVVEIDFCTRRIFGFAVKRHKTVLFRFLNHVSHRFAFGFRGIQKRFVALAEGIRRLNLRSVTNLRRVFTVIKQLFL